MMEINSYQKIKDFLYNKLKSHASPLPQSKISDEITSLRTVIATIQPDIVAKLLSIEEYINLNETDWERLARELETHFDVKLERGALIQGEEQRERDTTWWTTIYKQKSSSYYWDRYNTYLSDTLPPEVIKTLGDDTDVVMNNIENPSVQSFSRYGMVVGHVQSGKTSNYSALICKAADAGYKFIVVIAGGINNLRNQTQERLNESFIGQTKGVQVGAGKGNTSKDTLPLSLTTIERDFNKQDADRLSQGLNFDNISVPILLVIKKHGKTFDNVIDWLQKQYKDKVVNHAMLVIDDESDYASINTKEEDDPTTINKKIRQLLGLFQKSSYVAYTATPYANIFIDHRATHNDLGSDLFPKDFIYALEAPTNYFGAHKIFLTEMGRRHLVETDDFSDFIPTNHKKDFKVNALPPSLLDAICHFLLNVSIRHLRGQGNKHNSMLIHATRFTDVHKQLARLTEDYLKTIKDDVTSFGKLVDGVEQGQLIRTLKTTFDNRLSDIDVSWNEVINKLTDIIETVVVREVHQKTTVPLEYRDDIVTNAIVIGGTSLARGYTLEGLSISYFLRNTVFYDTLMQMGRWFGYRSGYEDLCRVYMPEERISNFADIIRATEELFEDFKLMARNNRTPNEFGLAVQENPDSALQVTARNKQKNVREYYYSMQLDGQAKETSYLISNKEDIDTNITAVKNLLDSLTHTSKTDGSYVWRSVDKTIIQKFLSEFKTFAADRLGLTTRMPITFIEQYVKVQDTDWDVALYSGTGNEFEHGNIRIKKEKRQFELKNKGKFSEKGGYYEVLNRQVSSGNSESIAIEDVELRKSIGNNRRAARAVMRRPLLMLHILEEKEVGEIKQDRASINEIAAFGVSFPGSVLSKDQTITLKINTVWYENLIKEMQDDNEADD